MNLYRKLQLSTALLLLVSVSTFSQQYTIPDRTGPEDLEHAKEIMVDFFNNSKLKKIAKDCAFGGTFPKSLIKFDALDSGIAMWFNFDLEHMELFLAVDRTKHPETGYIGGPLQIGQHIPLLLSKYDGSAANADIEEFLMRDTSSTARKGVARANQDYATTMAFRVLFENLLGKSFLGKLKQTTTYAFFENNQDSGTGSTLGLLRQLYDQSTGENIRYYIACNSKNPENRLRVLLFSVDEHGNNILYKKDSAGNILIKDDKKVSALILQRSIPPR